MSARGRILLFHQYFLAKGDPGGSRWTQLCDHFIDSGFTVDIIAGNIHYATGRRIGARLFSKEEVRPGQTVHRTWTYAGYNTNFVGRLLGYLSFMVSSVIRSIFLPRPQLVVVTSPPLFVGLSAWVISKLKRAPLVFEVRDLWPDSAVATGVVTNRHLVQIMYWIESLLYHQATKIIALTPAFKTDISKRFPHLAEKVSVITNAADFNLMPEKPKGHEVRQKLGVDGRLLFGYFGAHGLANDLGQILDVAGSLKDRRDLVFMLVGDGMMKPALVARAKEEGLHNVLFVDSIGKDKVFDYVDACDFCLATLKKTDVFKTVYPNKVFDYMASKKPVIVTIDGITRELVEGTGCGLYAEPENLPALKAAILTMAERTNTERSEMGKKGYECVRTQFDRQVLANRYRETLESML